MSTSFQQALRIRKIAKREKNKHGDCGGIEFDEERGNKAYEAALEREYKELEEVFKIKQKIEEIHETVVGKTCQNWYNITVRPKPSISFKEFIELLEHYTNRAFMLDYTLSLEQKSIEGTGEGFHTHIVARTKHRSKGECLRDTISTFNKICETQCIKVDPTRNPKDIINNYLIEYKSKDDHKLITKEGDTLWRNKNNILPLYTKNENPFSVLSIKYKTAQNSISNYIIEMD